MVPYDNLSRSPGIKSGDFSINKPFFVTPPAAWRRITAGFSYLQKIGKNASVDVWFPDCIHDAVDDILKFGGKPGADLFPAEWAAVRQFELLQEAGNICIYDLDPERLMRTIRDLTAHMKGGGHRVTVVTIGSYADCSMQDELAILDRRLQDRIASLINMLYLEEQSDKTNNAMAEALRNDRWDYQTALPHVGVTLGARDLFRPQNTAHTLTMRNECGLVPPGSGEIVVEQAARWIDDLGVRDAASNKTLLRVAGNPKAGQYKVEAGVYCFAGEDAGRDVLISYRYYASSSGVLSDSDRQHRRARHFFEILGLLPQNHIVHDTAVGLQLPESINENQWIYIAREGEKYGDFVRMMDNIFAPFNKLSLSELHGREDATPEIKGMAGHMRGYGDRLNANADQYYRNLAQFSMS